jgi:hypothetical protein
MNDALGQRPALVRATIVKGEDPVVGATENGDIPAGGLEDTGATPGNVLELADFNPFAHR